MEHRCRGRHGVAAAVGVTRLALTDFRNYRAARLALDTGAGRADRAERRRQDQSARSRFVSGAGARAARRAGWPRSTGRPRDRRRSPPPRPAAGRSPRRSRRGAAQCGSAPAATRREAASAAWCASTASRRAARRRSASMLGVVWLTPQMDRLFLEGPAAGGGFSTGWCWRSIRRMPPGVGAYEQAMRERARLLRAGVARTGRPIRPGSPRSKRSWRRRASRSPPRGATRCDRLDRACAAAEGPFPRARLALVGAVEAWLDEMPALAAEDEFAAALGRAAARRCARRRRRDRARTAPISRSRMAPSGIAGRACSTGEQKALADRDRAGSCANCSVRRAASRRCCCSTRSRRISMRTGAPRSSRRWPSSKARSGSPAPMPRCSRRCAMRPVPVGSRRDRAQVSLIREGYTRHGKHPTRSALPPGPPRTDPNTGMPRQHRPPPMAAPDANGADG